MLIGGRSTDVSKRPLPVLVLDALSLLAGPGCPRIIHRRGLRQSPFIANDENATARDQCAGVRTGFP